jgi:hypothetical protein
MSMASHGIEIVHRFSIKDNFKGTWDAAGKVMKNAIDKWECEEVRSDKALTAFKNCVERGCEFDKTDEWELLERNPVANAKNLRASRTFQVYSRQVFSRSLLRSIENYLSTRILSILSETPPRFSL